MRLLGIFLLSIIFCVPPSAAHARQYTQTAFAPSPEATDLIVRTIESAKTSVNVAAYYFTSEPIADALVKTHKRGVEVKVLLDRSQEKRQYAAIEELREAGIPVRINRHYAIMHNKYIVVDSKTVKTGSFNYTASAEKRNAENVIVIRNNPTLAAKYLRNWKKLWDEGEEYNGQEGAK